MKRIVAFVVFAIWALPAFATDYNIDVSHSHIGFKVRHLGISYVSGKFLSFEGTFRFDPKNIEASSTEAAITADSIDTANQKRDKHLRDPDFLEADKYRLLTFKSKKVHGVNGNKFKVLGDLTMHGVTKPVVLDVEFNGAVKDPWGNERAAFTATTAINRKDYGLTWNKLLETGGFVVGEEVKITIEIEGVKKKEA